MPQRSRSRKVTDQIESLVRDYSEKRRLFELLAESLVGVIRGTPRLMNLLHSIRFRTKEPESLRRKLVGRLQERRAKGKDFDVDATNLFAKVNDLAGIRLLHLNTTEIGDINTRLLEVLDEYKYKLVEGPVANCWDVEYEDLFSSLDIKTRSRSSMYTSVHYVVQANQREKVTCEIQVRTLMDEVWGEVSHRVNYPEESGSRSCRDQLKVLARVTTAGIRLVDSIVKSHEEVRAKPLRHKSSP